MGNGTSFEQARTVFLDVNGKEEKIIFSRNSSSRDIHELIAQASGTNRHAVISLRDRTGAHVSMSPTMPLNTAANPYKVHAKEASTASVSMFGTGSTVLKWMSNEVTRQTDFRRKGTNRHEVNQYVIVISFFRLFQPIFHYPSLNYRVFNLKAVPVINRNLPGDGDSFQAVLTHVAEQLNRVFKMEETKSHLDHRINMLEKRIEVEGLKAVEIEKCKSEISYIRDQLWNTHKNTAPISDEIKVNLRRDVPSYPKYTLSQETVDYLKQPTFDIWHWEPNEMLSLLEHMYHELGLVEEFNINPIVLKRWLLCVQENYRNNPFHNFRHCFCVSQMMYGMIHLCKLWERMGTEDLGILLTAAVSHDLDHPGYNNTYQINARTELAIRYNDISPLENHHCAVAFQILSHPDTNIFANVDKDTFKRIRAGITMLILATDMARHGEIMESFKDKIATGFDDKNKEHLDTLKMVLIKCCDISNEVRPMEVSEPWVDCLLEEYFNQSDREKVEGLPVAPFMDRDKVTKPTAQIGFIKFVLIPMFETVSKVFDQIDEVMVQPLRKSKDRYEVMKSVEEAQKQKETPT